MSESLHEHVPSSLELRAMLEAMVVKDLRGPSLPDEEIDEPSVRDRYLVGMLAPRRQFQDDHAEPASTEVEDEADDTGGDFPPDDLQWSDLPMGGIQDCRVLLTQPQRKVVADLLPSLVDRLKLDEKNSRTISFTAKELETIKQKAEAALPNADTGMKRNSLRHVVDAVSKALEDAEGIASIPASERLYQFKIALMESKPSIWRRIQVKNCILRRGLPDWRSLRNLE